MRDIAVFASGSGSNFQAIIDAVIVGTLHANIKLLVCDRPEARVIERAKENGIPAFVFSPKDFANKEAFEQVILREMKKYNVSYIVLAGYMRLIGPTLLGQYSGRIINIHPSLLPAFPGKDAIGQALESKVKETGITIHFVDEGMDTGPIIAQKKILLDEHETKESLQEKIHKVEHQFYPAQLQKLLTAK
ncbi:MULTISPECIES: phosphoribosylglycinamide formyltransferase [unclassified Bacillus (in: firmicutes)]|uniref:phosphoribosylglycinamide formyltransferase n=1 Tax=unclassified Bacillus (in: firmicutes) TaxID=185979 RepID=UPI0008F1BCA7|nr:MULTISPECIES: phosphoribosylglycinamide formyltransferase [unclassified Bacillus (in: firmicutes)]SFB23610.1 formyltetrahydrofolate-dependent phosphoribosylglycinamide formyltransferase [Bacillus sp. UNCCL13]SFQ87851.1 formyltetrahydrofolate-dependent phosphoribosylglycinamide formyltransferase [Bacillus sp. cl95]